MTIDTEPMGVNVAGSEALSGLPLRTARLTLRLHRREDAAWLHDVYSRPDVVRFLLDEPWALETAELRTQQRILKCDLGGEVGALALVIQHRNIPIGDVQVWFSDEERRTAEIGWVLNPDHSGQGFAREAVHAALDLAFEHYRVRRVVAQMDARNLASARLARAVGMQQEALLRQHWWTKGEWVDTMIFGMLAGDRTRREA